MSPGTFSNRLMYAIQITYKQVNPLTRCISRSKQEVYNLHEIESGNKFILHGSHEAIFAPTFWLLYLGETFYSSLFPISYLYLLSLIISTVEVFPVSEMMQFLNFLG